MQIKRREKKTSNSLAAQSRALSHCQRFTLIKKFSTVEKFRLTRIKQILDIVGAKRRKLNLTLIKFLPPIHRKNIRLLSIRVYVIRKTWWRVSSYCLFRCGQFVYVTFIHIHTSLRYASRRRYFLR